MDKKIVIIGAGVSTQYGVLHLLKNGYEPKWLKNNFVEEEI